MKTQLTVSLLLSLCFGLCVSTLLIWLLLSVNHQDISHRHGCDMSPLTYGITWFIILLMAVSALTSYLNLKPYIRNNTVRSASAFFLLPVLMTGMIIFTIGEISSAWPVYLISTGPYLIALLFSFHLFRKKYNHLI